MPFWSHYNSCQLNVVFILFWHHLNLYHSHFNFALFSFMSLSLISFLYYFDAIWMPKWHQTSVKSLTCGFNFLNLLEINKCEVYCCNQSTLSIGLNKCTSFENPSIDVCRFNWKTNFIWPILWPKLFEKLSKNECL